MSIDPNVGDSIILKGARYGFTEAPNAPGIIYAEIGRKAKVYRLTCDNQPFALKAFTPKYRRPDTVENTVQIARFQDVDGLAVAGRQILTPVEYPDLIRFNEAFNYAVLMPWIEGHSWFNYVSGRLPIEPAQSLRLARSFINSVSQLEQRDLAHCDLSSSNFIFSPDCSHVELIDIEDMFGYGLLPPKEKPKGTGGYAPTWIKAAGVWEAAGDRFSAGILVSEILAWQFEDVRGASNGDAYFAEGEFGNKSARFHLMEQRLGQIHPELSRLFKTVWYAESLEGCPRVNDWKRVLDGIREPRLEISPSFLEFGTLDLRTKPATSLHASFTIRNTGGGVLNGRIISNVSWLAVTPDQFSCAADTSSLHALTLEIDAPADKHHQSYIVNGAVTIRTDQESKSLSGKYSVLQPKAVLQTWMWVLSLIFLIICCTSGALLAGWALVSTNSSIAPSVSNIRMTTDETGKTQTALYSPSDKFYVFADLSGLKVGSIVEAKWYAVEANGVSPNSEINTSDYTYESGIDYVYFQLATSDGGDWPIGSYRVELYLDGAKVGEQQFRVQ